MPDVKKKQQQKEEPPKRPISSVDCNPSYNGPYPYHQIIDARNTLIKHLDQCTRKFDRIKPKLYMDSDWNGSACPLPGPVGTHLLTIPGLDSCNIIYHADQSVQTTATVHEVTDVSEDEFVEFDMFGDNEQTLIEVSDINSSAIKSGSQRESAIQNGCMTIDKLLSLPETEELGDTSDEDISKTQLSSFNKSTSNSGSANGSPSVSHHKPNVLDLQIKSDTKSIKNCDIESQQSSSTGFNEYNQMGERTTELGHNVCIMPFVVDKQVCIYFCYICIYGCTVDLELLEI